MNHLRRIISLLWVLVLCFGLIPGVSAAEVDTPGTDIPTEVTEETAPPTTEDTTPTEEPAPEKPPTEETLPEESISETESTEPPSEDVPQDGPGVMGAIPNGTSTWAIGSTQMNISQNKLKCFIYLFPKRTGIFSTINKYRFRCTFEHTTLRCNMKSSQVASIKEKVSTIIER